MNHLSKLSPAETLLLLQGKDASLKELLKVTFMDLILKQVLRTSEAEKQVNADDKELVIRYVEVGSNFSTYRPLLHENNFLSPFQRSHSIKILFRNMIKMGYQNAASLNNFRNILITSPALHGCFTQNLLQTFFGGFNITKKGIELQGKIQAEMEQIGSGLSTFTTADHPKVLDILKVIQGNILLFATIRFDLLYQIDTALTEAMRREDDEYIDEADSLLDIYNSFSESFDSDCGADGGGGGDGGSDGGDGGGCGGCGGGS